MNDIDKLNSQLRGALTPQRTQQLVSVTVALVVATIALSIFVSWWFVCLGPLVFLAAVSFLMRDVLPRMSSSGGMPRNMVSAPTTGQFDVTRLDDQYRGFMERALQTRLRIDQVVTETSDPGLRGALTGATQPLPELMKTIYDLALKAQSIKTALYSTGDMARITADIERLNQEIKSTTDEFQKGQYYANLDGKLQQMQNLTDTTVALRRWDAQLDNAVSTLDTILSQVVRVRSSEVLGRTDATDDVSRSLREQVESLKAASDAFDTLYRPGGTP